MWRTLICLFVRLDINIRPSKKKKRVGVAKFFAEQADEADDDESDSEGEPSGAGKHQEEILTKDKLEAVARVQRRHEENRKALEMSAEEQARQYQGLILYLCFFLGGLIFFVYEFSCVICVNNFCFHRLRAC